MNALPRSEAAPGDIEGAIYKERHNGSIQAGIVAAIGILDDTQKKLKGFAARNHCQRGPEYCLTEIENHIARLGVAKEKLANCLDVASRAWAMSHGGAVEVDLDEIGIEVTE